MLPSLVLNRLCIEDNIEPRVSVHGFADYTDVVAQDLVPWTPLKTSEFINEEDKCYSYLQ